MAKVCAEFALVCLLLAGCAVGPDYAPPKAPTPANWTEASAAPAATLHLNDWWKTFNDPVLNHLIEEAILSNLDLKLAESRIREARANRNAVIAAGLPDFSARSLAMRRRNNANIATTGGGAAGGGFGVGDQIIDIFQMGFDASWELDVFGGVRRALESAEARVESEEEGRRDALVTLLGEVARNYIELRSNQQLLAVTRDNLKSQVETLELIRMREQAGLTSGLEVAQTEALAANTRAQGPIYEAAARQSIHALALLLGKTPDTLSRRLAPEGPLPESAEAGLADLPSELLRRRPDIRRAERQLAAASADIGVATADLYPRINLTAFLGLQNTNIATFTPIGKSWSMASTLTTPIFNWGRIQSNIRAKEALSQAAFVEYQNTVLKAFKEVEGALVAHIQESQRIGALEQAVDAQRLALTLSAERYRKGLTAYLDVLTAERGLFQAQLELVQGRTKKSSQLVALYKALGGGWEAADKTPNVSQDWSSQTTDFILENIRRLQK